MTLATLMATCAPLVHPTTLRALIDVESAGNPYAVSVNRPQALSNAGIDPPGFEQPTNAREALQLTRALAEAGFTTSLGLAQINTAHLRKFHLHLTDLFNPCTNLAAAQRILLDCDAAQLSAAVPRSRARLHRTLSCYNTGDFTTGIRNNYANTVGRAAMRRDRDARPPRNPT